MQKLLENEKSFSAGAKSTGFFGKGFNSNIFALGIGLSMVSNIITNVTDMIAQDEYIKNPNPMYSANTYSWNGSNMRIGPNWNRSSYSVLGGW